MLIAIFDLELGPIQPMMFISKSFFLPYDKGFGNIVDINGHIAKNEEKLYSLTKIRFEMYEIHDLHLCKQ